MKIISPVLRHHRTQLWHQTLLLSVWPLASSLSEGGLGEKGKGGGGGGRAGESMGVEQDGLLPFDYLNCLVGNFFSPLTFRSFLFLFGSFSFFSVFKESVRKVKETVRKYKGR